MLNVNYIQQCISKCRLGKNELCARAKIARTTLDSILNGGDTRISTLEAIANVLNISVSSMFDNNCGNVHTEGPNSPASYYGNPHVTSDNKYLESLLEEKDKRIQLLETILKNNNLL